jgi:hypothetical protein
MNKFYPDKDDATPETVWQFTQQRDSQRSANRNSAVSRQARAAVKRIEAMLKEKVK